MPASRRILAAIKVLSPKERTVETGDPVFRLTVSFFQFFPLYLDPCHEIPLDPDFLENFFEFTIL